MIIGIAGRMRSGKDTFAKAFISTRFSNNDDYVHESWGIVKFATKIREVVSVITGLPVGWLETNEGKAHVLGHEWDRFHLYYFEKEVPHNLDTIEALSKFVLEHTNPYHKFTYEVERLTVRKLLQTLGTECGRDVIHNNIWVNALMSQYRNGLNWVISDVRFPNEVKAVRDNGGVMIKIVREFGQSLSDHSSENSLDDWVLYDYIVNNNGSLRDLERQVVKISSEIKL